MAYSDPGTVTGGVTPARATWANTVRGDLVDHEARIVSLEAVTKLATVTLTNAQIKALPTTPFTIVAAPGAGKILWPKNTLLLFNYTAPYTNINGVSGLYASITGLTGSTVVQNDSSLNAVSGRGFYDPTTGITLLSEFLAPVVDVGMMLTYPFTDSRGAANWDGPLTYVFGSATVANQPLQLQLNNSGSGDLTGGNAANTLMVVTEYTEITIP